MRKLAILFILIGPNWIFAQDFSIYGSAGRHYGISRDLIGFGGDSINYSYGSGFSFQAGVQFDTHFNLFFYSDLGLQGAVVYKKRHTIFGSYKSSFFFNYKSISVGAGKLFPIHGSNSITGLKFNGGLDLNFPGSAKLTEYDTYQGKINYKPTLGYHLEFKLSSAWKNVFYVEPGISFNSTSFIFSSYDWNGTPNDRKLTPNATNFGISLTIRKIFEGSSSSNEID